MANGKKIKRALLVTGIAAAVFAAAWSGTWLFYRWSYYDRIVKGNPGFIEQGGGMYKLRMYEASEDPTYSMALFFPRFPHFTGNYCVSSALHLCEDGTTVNDDYVIGIDIKPCLIGEARYTISVSDYTDSVERKAGSEDIKRYYFTTNADMEVLCEYRGSSAEILEKAGDRISEMFMAAKENFCID